ncbi:MAG: carbamoyltransferase [Candidatus Omnitrophica bacterium]|nr:carbamoyltransferase [Candidatus Omnitrophota bacterium]
MIILGINAYHPDSSAALMIDGKLIAACEEERFKRVKHFAGFPDKAVEFCLREAGISARDLDYIALPRDPRARIFKKLLYGIKIPPLLWRRVAVLKKALGAKEEISRALGVDVKYIKARVAKIEHHRAHLASSFFASNFDKAFLFSCDALGDFASTAWGIGEGKRLRILGEITFPHSLGFYYTAVTQLLGFLKFGDEYKVMGLAPYGEDRFRREFEDIVRIKNNGFELNLRYFTHHRKYVDMNFEDGYPKVDPLFSERMEKLLGKRRNPDEPLEKKHKDIAFSLQKRLEDAVIHLINTFSKGDICNNLCLSGGTSHNSVACGLLPERTHFKNIYVPPAPGDAGLAMGAAFYLWNDISRGERNSPVEHAYWGPGYDEKSISFEIDKRKSELTAEGCTIEKAVTEDALCHAIASELTSGKVIGWFQGRMELGPRALGNRSIIVDPRREDMKNVLNKRVKHREPFRPFAPSILEEYAGNYFGSSLPSPFMSFVYKVKDEKKDMIPAVCHVDGTARAQTVSRKTNPLYWNLINKFRGITEVPLLLNTSFNENEPIVRSPGEAIDCFLRTKMDILVLGTHIMRKRLLERDGR